MEDEKLTDGFTDEEIWGMPLTTSSSAAIIAQKIRLYAEAATWLEPRVRRVRRRVQRTNQMIEAYLAAHQVS